MMFKYWSVGGGDNVHANSPLTAGYWEGCDTAAPRPHINQAHEDGAMLMKWQSSVLCCLNSVPL